MKKLIITMSIILGLGLTSFAAYNGGGLFLRGEEEQGNTRDGGTPALPIHGQSDNQNAPVGTGIVLLSVLGGAYLVGKKRREE